jgi:hypothetical protein
VPTIVTGKKRLRSLFLFSKKEEEENTYREEQIHRFMKYKNVLSHPPEIIYLLLVQFYMQK